ncbi:VOC family protein [Actinomadura citrea]|uniref:Putative enzyme related to lactoylglutathione lyase n=1 Tax=Actinomadura citrea TaxID=46158 RepID=A0A7Y9KAL9_9ACTN|nr:VOC family protein [Actinomadura citrea]NYE10420.1 putative enzyme related to lactoylglutathione lyase [Actinomadura citrea]GGT72107.1 glyoxalase [Actinomadura citrea]
MSVLNALGAVIIDCADHTALAEFYRKATGWEVAYGDDDVVYLGNGSAPQLALQRIEGYRPPAWPGPAKHAHLDFAVTDVEVAVKELLALGASRPDTQPGEGEWAVLIDPAGHPFCIAAGD